MSDLDYNLAIKYTSNLADVLKVSVDRINEHEKFLKSTPLRLAYDIDDKLLAQKLNEMETRLKQFVSASQSTTASGGGVLGGTLTQTQQQAKQIQGLLERTVKEIGSGNKKITRTTEKFQGSDGAIITTVSQGDKRISKSTTTKDRERELSGRLRDGRFESIQKDIDTAAGAGDISRQLRFLRERNDLLQELKGKYADIAASPAYKKVEGGIQRTSARIDNLSGRSGASLDKQRDKSIEQNRKDAIAQRQQSLIKELSSGRFAQISSGISQAQGAGDTTREVTLLRERLTLLKQLQSQYQDIASSAAYRKVEGGEQRTNTRIDTLTGRAGASMDKQRQKSVESNRKDFFDDQNRAARQQSDLSEKSYKSVRDSMVAERARVKTANELLNLETRIANLDAARIRSLEQSAAAYRSVASAARSAGNVNEAKRSATLADNFERQAASLRTSLGGKDNQKLVKAEQGALENELRIAKQTLATEQTILAVELKRAKALADIAQRNNAVDAVVQKQKRSLDAFAAKAGDISASANLRGFNSLGTKAGDAAFNASNKSQGLIPSQVTSTANATANLGQKAKSSSKSIASIATTFFQWNIAARAVTAGLNTIGTAIDGVIAVDRQFAVLRTIFRGTAQEAQKLKKDVLDLAAANGRSADEALQAATGFARLGLNRVQIAKLVETSLIAANVAEISSADAAEKLTSLMQQYKLSVDEVASALGRLNSISNTQNVTVGQLLSNISLTASVARQAGIALEDLEGIIGTTIASTRSTSSEIGNAIKFVLQRIRKPETLDALKLEFDIDLTKANGDLREGTEIIGELARLYPLLNKAEQTRLLDLAAGTRQASRFATVLETFNTAQNVTANAVGDTNSALRENENITETLASRLQGLETAWISFATAVGDTGVIETFIAGIETARGAVNALKDATPVTNQLKVKTQTAQKIRKDRDDTPIFDIFKFSDRKFSKEELQNAKKAYEVAEKFIQQRKDALKGEKDPSKRKSINDNLDSQKKNELKSLGFDDIIEGPTSIREALAEINKVLGEESKKKSEASITLARGRVQEFERGFANAQTQAANLREQIDKGVVDPKRVRSDFTTFRNVIDSADGGASIFADSLTKVNAALEKGDYATVVSEIERIGAALQKELPDRRNLFDKVQGARVTDLQKQITQSESARKNLEKAGASPDKILESIEATTQLQQELEDVQKKANAIEVDPLTSMRQAKLTQFFDALKTRTEEITKAFGEIQAGENSNTATLQFGRASSENFARLDSIRNALNATISQADSTIAAIPDGATDRNQQIALQQEIISAAKTRLTEEVKIAEQQDKQNRLLVEANRIRDAVRESRTSFSIQDAAGGAGANQSEKLADQLRVGTGIFAKEDFLTSLSPPTSSAALAASQTSILAAQEVSQSRLIDLRIREQQILQETRQAGFDMLKAEKERTDQASKRLALASREEQLIAAALAATIRAGGTLTKGQFLGLSQQTRQTADSFNGANPFSSDDSPQGQFNRAVTDLGNELATAREAIARYTGVIQENQSIIEKRFAPGGELAARISGDPAQAAQGALVDQNRFGGIVLNANGLVMNINLAQGFAALQEVMTVQIESRINREFDAIKQAIRNISNRNTSPDLTPALNAE